MTENKAKIEKKIEERAAEIAESQAERAEAALLELISIPSYQGAAEPGAPFGREPGRVLQKVAELAERLGFVVRRTDHYVIADLGDGMAPDTMGVLCHADVVPFGEGWHFAPTGEIVADRIYGRGALDDKGPLVALLFALAGVRDAAAELGGRMARPVRVIIGANEESGSLCMQKYVREENIPAFGFSPDANFPVIFAEKGIALMSATADVAVGHIISMHAGTVVNAVPGNAEAVLDGIAVEDVKKAINAIKTDENAECVSDGNGVKEGVKQGLKKGVIVDEIAKNRAAIRAVGRAAHGSQPEKGINAAGGLLRALSAIPLLSEEAELVERVGCLFGSDHTGRTAGIACSDEVSGALTLNLGVVDWQDGRCRLALDMRYPVTADFAGIYRRLSDACAANGLKLTIDEHKEPLYVPKDSELVMKLLELYREYEPDAEALAIGGGTYCRSFSNFVAFGPLRRTTADLMHQADEYITREDFAFLREIYARAIWRLAGDR